MWFNLYFLNYFVFYKTLIFFVNNISMVNLYTTSCGPITGRDCSIPHCPGGGNCNGHGDCDGSVDPPQCTTCYQGWVGYACETPCIMGNPDEFNRECICNTTCLHGPSCNIECSEHGHCDEDYNCMCDAMSGWIGRYCEIPSCPRHPDSVLPCSGHGDCNSALQECSCYNGWTGIACHIPDCPGTPDCHDRGYCNATFDPPRCTNCTGPWMGPVCDDPCVHGQESPKDSFNCVCEPGWTGLGCDSECSGNGNIVNGSCICDWNTGWKGSLCNIPGCPGLFDFDCSGRGKQ